VIETDRLRLRSWRESDLKFLQGLRNDVELQALLLADARGSSVSAVRKWLSLKSNGSDSFFFVAELSPAEEVVGYLQLSRVIGADNAIQLGICLAKEHWSFGYGAELIEAAEKYSHLHHGTRKIMLHVDTTNFRAVACYKKLGYREVGVMRSHVFVQTSLRDVMIMEKLSSFEMEALV
jgi:RimJ/RimL family protein N-acetyltransferase